ncbi:MAG: hypothetical protein C0501_07710 [Isosphaera sp.]|nr:hypothetical protein [Isosphaera sp.]
MSRPFRAETAFFLAAWLLLLVAFRERGFYDPGSLWHVTVGEIILTTGMPQTDPFSYTFEGVRWVPQQWGAEVLMALAHRAGGLDTLLLAFAAGLAALYTLIFRRCVEGGMGPVLAALVVGGALFVGAFHYFVRPHMFTVALLGWTMMCVVDYEAGRRSAWRLLGLVPLFVLWTNLHGGVLGGTMTLGLAVAGWGVLFLANRDRQGAGVGGRRDGHPLPDGRGSPIRDWRTAFLLGGIVVACLLTPFVNPHGLEMLRIWRRIVASEVLPRVIHEHMPLDPATPVGLAVVASGAAYLVLLAGALPKLRVTWLIPLVWLALSFKGIRQGPLFAVTAAVAAADLWRHTVWHRLLVRYGDGSLARDDPPPRPGVRWAAVPAAAVLLALGLQATRVPVPVVGHGWARLDPDFVPTDLTPYVATFVDRPGARVFNDANLGGYLIYHAPRLKVFMDDRCELYGDRWIEDYADAIGRPPGELGPVFEGWHARYRFDWALVMTHPKEAPPVERYLLSRPDEWRVFARGRRAVLFQKVMSGE